MIRFTLPLLFLVALSGCRGTPDPPPVVRGHSVAWHALGTWSGRGHKQTESFTSDIGTLRVRWEATNAEASAVFQLTVHSAISGRPLEQIVDHTGAGSGTAYLYEDPRVFHAVVDSSGMDWSFTVEEAVSGVVAPGRGRAGDR